MQNDIKNLERSGYSANLNVFRIGELRQKEVINLGDSRRPRFVKDIEFSLETEGLFRLYCGAIVTVQSLWNRSEMVIPWRDIRKIGEEIILVDIKDG